MQTFAHGFDFNVDIELSRDGLVTCATVDAEGVTYEVGFVSRPGRYLVIDVAATVDGAIVRDHDYTYNAQGVKIRQDHFVNRDKGSDRSL